MYACMHDRRTHLPPGDDELSSANEWTIEQNKQLLLHLKQQNKEVKGVSTGARGGGQQAVHDLVVRTEGPAHQAIIVTPNLVATN